MSSSVGVSPAGEVVPFVSRSFNQLAEYTGLRRDIVACLDHQGVTPETAEIGHWHNAVAGVIMAHTHRRWEETRSSYRRNEAPHVYYLSMEFLIGPNTHTALHGAGEEFERDMRTAISTFGQNPDEVLQYEPDPGLGNGGLGRLAACFMDSTACQHLPMMGHCIEYRDGFFRQEIDENGRQIAKPDSWMEYGRSWSVLRQDRTYPVRFFGQEIFDEKTKAFSWEGAATVNAYARDVLIPGYDGRGVNTLRLWTTDDFHQIVWRPGDDEHNRRLGLMSQITARLYPDDTTDDGKTLRLMQEYFFTSLALQDALRRHIEQYGSLNNFADKNVFQINDTHPAIAIPEMMRLLMDEHGQSWDQAKVMVKKVFRYTNHTLMPEALEKWHVGLMAYLLPRHSSIIRQLNADLMQEARESLSGKGWTESDIEALQGRISIVSGDHIRMANLATFHSANINGVSALHTDLMRDLSPFQEFSLLRGKERILNHTNGISPRRWLLQANPELAVLNTAVMGDDEWVTDLSRLEQVPDIVRALESEDAYAAEFKEIKHRNKVAFAEFVKGRGGPDINPDALFDVHIKRFHEYKRQQMNLLQTIALYQDILDNPDADRQPIVKIFAGKAAPGYERAKDMIALVHALADKVNNDPRVGDKLKIVFVENYNVSSAMKIIPAADLSEQISTAGTEASGTSNMKFALNGALTIGTRDGANVEIGEKAGEENIFFFGLTSEEVMARKSAGYDPKAEIAASPRLRKALDLLYDRNFWSDLPEDQKDRFAWLADSVEHNGDQYLCAADFESYWAAHQRACDLYRNEPGLWTRKSIRNMVAGSAFSSDDTILGYAKANWGVGQQDVAAPCRSASPTLVGDYCQRQVK